MTQDPSSSFIPTKIAEYCEQQGLVSPYKDKAWQWWGHPFTEIAEAVQIPDSVSKHVIRPIDIGMPAIDTEVFAASVERLHQAIDQAAMSGAFDQAIRSFTSVAESTRSVIRQLEIPSVESSASAKKQRRVAKEVLPDLK